MKQRVEATIFGAAAMKTLDVRVKTFQDNCSIILLLVCLCINSRETPETSGMRKVL